MTPDTLAFLFAPEDAGDPPVTIVREIRVHPDQHAEFERLMGVVIREASRRPGHLGATVVAPAPCSRRLSVHLQVRPGAPILRRGTRRMIGARLVEPLAALIESDRF